MVSLRVPLSQQVIQWSIIGSKPFAESAIEANEDEEIGALIFTYFGLDQLSTASIFTGSASIPCTILRDQAK